MSNQTPHRRRKGLLPGELEQMKKEELSQKRRFRLLQVREQAKGVASDIRESVKKEKAKQLEQLKEDALREKNEEKENALQNLRQQYCENVSEIGSAWRAAQNQALVQEEQRVKTHLNNKAASERGHQALEEYWKENALKKESSKSALQARKFALEIEKERAAYIASLPPPKPDPVDALLESSGKVVSTQKIMRPDINVEKANPEEEPDACEAALVETNKQQQMESEKVMLQQKRGKEVKNRFREAWKKKTLTEEFSRTLKDIENEERLTRNEARQNYYPDENKYFMCSPLDKQVRKDMQARAEGAFQKHFRAESDHEDSIAGEYSFHEIEKTEENAEITDYIEPPLRKPCTSLLESDFEEVDSRDDLVDELNVAYIESPEQREVPKKMSEAAALSSLLVKLRKRRAELRDEGERTVQLCLGVKSLEEGKPEEKVEVLPPKSVAVQAGKVFPPISTGIQTAPLEETGARERVASTLQKVQTEVERVDARVETAVQVDSDLERHAIESVTTAATKESSSSTSYMSLPPHYGIPQFARPAQTECDICDVERSQATHASRGKHEPLLIKQDSVVQTAVSRIVAPLPDTVRQQKVAESEVTHDTGIKGTSELYHSEISSESLASYMKHIMTKYGPPDSGESDSETEPKTVFPLLDFSTAVKYVEPFSVVSPGRYISSADSEIAKASTVITSTSDQLQLSIQPEVEHEQQDVSDQVFVEGNEPLASSLGVLNLSGENIRKRTVSSDDGIYNQIELTQKMLLSQFLDTSSTNRDEDVAKQLQDYFLNLNIFKSRPPVKIHRVIPGEVLMGHELSTIQEIDSLGNGSSTDRVQNLSKSDVMSSSGTFQPLTPVSHFDSPIVDHRKQEDVTSSSGTFQPLTPVSHLDSPIVDRRKQELPDSGPFPEMLHGTEAGSQKSDERQLPYSVSGSTESFQPMTPVSYHSSTDEIKSDEVSSVPSSLESFHFPVATEAEGWHAASHFQATSGVASFKTTAYKTEMMQTAENRKEVSKISRADSSAATFHPLSSDHDSSFRTAQISFEREDTDVSKFLRTQRLEVLQQIESTDVPVVSSESVSRDENIPTRSVEGIKYAEASSGPYQLMTLKTDSSVATETLHSHSKQIVYASSSSGSFQPMSATVDDSQMSSHTVPEIVVSDFSVPAMSIVLEGNEQSHFGSSLPSYLVSTKIQHPSVSGVLSSTKRDGIEPLPSSAERIIIPGQHFPPSVPPLFHKPSVSDSGGSFHQMTSHLESDVTPITAGSTLRNEPVQVTGTQISEFPAGAQAISLPSSPQKVAKMSRQPTANERYRNLHQGGQSSNLAKMVLKRNTSSSSGSISSSQESLISVFTESKIAHQSTPIKAREVAVQGAGILEEPDLTLIGSEISCSLNTTPRKHPEVANETLIEESTAPPPSSFQSSAQEMRCPSVESVEQKRDHDSGSEAGHFSAVSSNPTTPVSDYSAVLSPVSASLLSFEKHEIEFAEPADVSPSVPSCSKLEINQDLSSKTPSGFHKTLKHSAKGSIHGVHSKDNTPLVLSRPAESNFLQATSSQNNTPTTGTPKLYLKSSTDYKSRTKRLWNNLAEVREKKLAEEKKQAFIKNKEKVKELQMKIQKSRKTATPKK